MSKQDEQKKIEDNERRSREEFSDRAERLYSELEDNMQQIENPDSGKPNVEMDELYVATYLIS